MEWEKSRVEKTKDRQPEEWRSSDGHLQEQKGKKGGKLEGYEPSDREKTENDKPKKLGGMESSYGDLSIGINRKRELVMVTSQKRTKELAATKAESKELKGQTAVGLRGGVKNVKVNSSQKQESAIGQRESVKKNEPYVMGRMSLLLENRHLDVQEQIAPFLTSKPEKNKLEDLTSRKKELYQKGGEVQEKDALQRETAHLEKIMVEKEQEKTRFCKRLMTLRTQANESIEEKKWDFFQSLFTETNEELGEDGQEDSTAGAQEEDGDKGKSGDETGKDGKSEAEGEAEEATEPGETQ